MRRSLLGLLLLACPVLAQELLWVRPGGPHRNLGISGTRMTGIGDINQDGYEDLGALIGGGVTFLALHGLWLVSGRDGTVLREVIVPAPYQGIYRFGDIAAAGDHNSDGVPDYVVTGGGPFEVAVHSGVDDAILWSVPYTGNNVVYEIVSDLDLDGDGRKDVVAGAYFGDNYQGEVRAYSHGGVMLWQLQGSATNPPMLIANDFAPLGDVDGDAGDDFVMGAWDMQGYGAGVVVSGRTGAFLQTCYGELPGDGIGFRVTEAGDLDGDGAQDFIAASRGIGVRAVARAFSSRTGQLLHQWLQVPGDNLFSSMTSRGVDLDGDGIGDLLGGDPSLWRPSGLQGGVRGFSGRTGAQLFLLDSQPLSAGLTGRIGAYTAALKTPAGEPGTFVVANGQTLLTGVGSGVFVAYRGIPRTSLLLGPACPGNLPSAPSIGMASLGASGVRIHLTDAPPQALAVLLLGLSTTSYGGVPLPASLDPLGLPGCVLRTSIESMQTSFAGTLGTHAGYAFADVAIPVPVTGNGTWDVSAQWLVLGDATTFPGGMTQAIRWRH